jgi:GPH family glycoside/pentoside/hexuronide:cation symporter
MFWIAFWSSREQIEVQSQEHLPLVKAFKATLTNIPFLIQAAGAVLLMLGVFTGLSIGPFVMIYYLYGGENNEAASKLMGIAGSFTVPTGILGSFFWGWLGGKLGKKTAFLCCIGLFAFILPWSLLFYTPSMPYLALVHGFVSGFIWCGWMIFPSSMVADICDMDELETGRRREGAFSGVMGFLIKCTFALTAVVSGFTLHLIGYDEALAVQSASTVWRLRMSFAWLPTIFVVIVFILICFYPLTEEKVRTIRAELDQRRIQLRRVSSSPLL